MPHRYACPLGHCWDATTAVLPAEVRCPDCGRQGQTVIDASTFATAQLPPIVHIPASTTPHMAPEPIPIPVLAPGMTVGGYELQAELGRGAMGVVFRAYDPRQRRHVALKTIQADRRGLLLRFKQEFRALADVSHPNLATLYELASDGPVWFLTMELVQGTHFLQYVRPVPREPCLWDRVRPAFHQLAQAVHALHRAGVLHRDIKPSNVMVEPAGRVVLMDFGLVAEMDQAGQHLSTEPHLVGTIPYMAPEQADAQPVTPAADWYSVGVILYETLTGQLPFIGTWLDVLNAKRERDPVPPCTVAPEVPADLNNLCMALLHREPAARPRGEEILHRVAGAMPTAPHSAEPVLRGTPFVGRTLALQQLREAYAMLQQGRSAMVLVQGRSGMGKTALGQHFLAALRDAKEAVILTGRCYEREAVPFKALDGVLDSLSRYLRRLPDVEVRALLPRDVQGVARIFSVLREVRAVAEAASRGPETPDPHELRRRAWAGLKELLARLGDRRPLVVAIDDLQWGDEDSAALLRELLLPPDPPRMLLLGAFRSEDTDHSCVQALQQLDVANLHRQTLHIDALPPEEARTLALTLLDAAGDEAEAQAQTVVREAGGSPFFVQELARHAATMVPLQAASLDDVLWERICRLPEAAHRLLVLIAVAGRSLPLPVALHAADLPPGDPGPVQLLRTGRLLRLTGGAAEDVETYHDRIRETITARLDDADKRRCHRCLAQSLAIVADPDPEFLATHLHEAGETTRAGEFYAQAAERAVQALAFDRAVKLYHTALELGSWSDEQRRQLRIAYGDALANAGRGAEAAREYLAAVHGLPFEQTWEVQRRAALQLLISGYIDEGIDVLKSVLSFAGLRLPSSSKRALLPLLLWRLRLWLRGVHFKERDLSQCRAKMIQIVDIAWAAGQGLLLADYIRADYFQTIAVYHALNLGEPTRIIKSLALEVMSLSAPGTLRKQSVDTLLQKLEVLVQRVGKPQEIGYAALAKGALLHLEGKWKEAYRYCIEADTLFREKCVGLVWEFDTAISIGLWSLTYVGTLRDLAARWGVMSRDATERGDLYAIANLNTDMMAYLTLAADKPENAQSQLDEVMSRWSNQGFHLQHHCALLAHAMIQLYSGNASAWGLIAKNWSGYRSSCLIRVQQVRIDIVQTRVRAALLAARCNQEKAPWFQGQAFRDIRSLEKEQASWATALAQLFRGCLAVLADTPEEAVRHLRSAAQLLDQVDMYLFAAAARRRLGQLLKGDEGRALIAQADAWMKSQGIVNPARMTAMLAPGFPEE